MKNTGHSIGYVCGIEIKLGNRFVALYMRPRRSGDLARACQRRFVATYGGETHFIGVDLRDDKLIKISRENIVKGINELP